MVVNMLAALPAQSFGDAWAAGKMDRQQNALGQVQVQGAQNALLADTAGRLAQGVLSHPDPAAAYPMALQQARQMGMDVSSMPQRWGPEAEMFTRMFAMPEKERTDLQRMMELLPEDQRQQAAMVHMGLAPKAADPDVMTFGDSLVEVTPGTGQAPRTLATKPGDAPAGYRWTETGDLEYIGGGSQDPAVIAAQEAAKQQAKPQDARSTVAKIEQDFKDGLITQEQRDAAVKKATSDDAGITIGPDGTVQIGGTTASRNEAIKGSNAFQSIMTGLDGFQKLVDDMGSTGAAAIPGEVRDSLLVQRRNLQLQMKELYNLGVLNGPDLALMNELLIDPAAWSNIALDAAGIADIRQRTKSNIAQLKKLMTELIQPKLQQLGQPVPGAQPAGTSPPAGDSGQKTWEQRGAELEAQGLPAGQIVETLMIEGYKP